MVTYTEDPSDSLSNRSSGSDIPDPVLPGRVEEVGSATSSSDDEADKVREPSSGSRPEGSVTLHPSSPVEESVEQYDKFPLLLAWKSITPTGTFLDAYMSLASTDDSPEEFHFSNALIAIEFALGRDVRLKDNPPHLR